MHNLSGNFHKILAIVKEKLNEYFDEHGNVKRKGPKP